MTIEYVHGYSAEESTRLMDQATTLTGLLHADTVYPPGSLVLEAGCGVGAQTVILAGNSPRAAFTSMPPPPPPPPRHPDAGRPWQQVRPASSCGRPTSAARADQRESGKLREGMGKMAASSSNRPPKLAAGPLEEGRTVTAEELAWRADWIRLNTIDLVDRAGLGHYSSTFSCAEILAVLYYRVLRLWPSRPQWPDRDRFLLGKGHVATGLWPVLADLGYFPAEWMDPYGKIGSRVNDHPNMRLVPGIDFSSGSLGHNLSVGVGMSLAGRLQGLSHRTFVLTGDGELQEGQVWEAVMAAGHYHLGNLIMIVDANGFSGAGPTSAAMNIEPLGERLASFGWDAAEVDGHDLAALTAAFDALPARGGDRPVGVIARTRKGKGVRMMEESPQSWHLGHLSAQERARARGEIEARMR